MARTLIAAALVLLAYHATAQMQYTGNLAYNAPLVRRMDLATPEPALAAALGRRLMSVSNTARALLQTDAWGKPTEDADEVFPQAVASGDPQSDAVIIWTRVPGEGAMQVDWAIAEDKDMKTGLKTGSVATSSDVDYTVKVDVKGLKAKKVYYYQFRSGNSYSVVGRTKTLPTEKDASVDNVNFAVLSCSNYPVGFFHAYRTVAIFADDGKLDAVLHLGDYIYESASNAVVDGVSRAVLPNKEIVTLDDYLTRHRVYDSDPDLRAMRSSLPLIAVWDDHEFTNNAWHDGAQNHQPDKEGPWSERKDNAIKAYYLYQPIRQAWSDDKEKIYRNFRWGNLLNLIMVDTRYIGREEQYAGTYNDQDPRYNETHSMLGEEQRKWLYDQLKSSEKDNVQWKVMGNQVFFNKRYLNDANALSSDAWDGYAVERDNVLKVVEENDVRNFVVLTGDVHASYALDLTYEPKTYDPESPGRSQKGLGVELVCNSVTSGAPNFGTSTCNALKTQTTYLKNNPNMKYMQNYYKGFLLLEISRPYAQGTWVDMTTVKKKDDWSVTYSDTYRALTNDNRLQVVEGVYKPKTPAFTCDA